ncbi:hypothetical protein FEM48_Zijuj06G0162300 [Ziziphus jujuba var. spinosa]|uniref:Uncharacterized protein n=1 Tax=Ziziphus jujuba var. spinosa TaxID=714518 RepID=A0A978VAB1_ZIZJJ|nr:hypothetical protein FEM48_Zijuj06G0162300 [Ziziphus jujuba var. spinosa]
MLRSCPHHCFFSSSRQALPQNPLSGKAHLLRPKELDVRQRQDFVSEDMSCRMVFGKKYLDSEFNETGFKAVIQEGHACSFNGHFSNSIRMGNV